MFLASLLGIIVLIMWATHRWAGHPLAAGVAIVLGVWGAVQFAAGRLVITANMRLWGAELNALIRRMRKYRALSENPVPSLNRVSAFYGPMVLCLSFFFEIRWAGLAVALLGTCAFQGACFPARD